MPPRLTFEPPGVLTTVAPMPSEPRAPEPSEPEPAPREPSRISCGSGLLEYRQGEVSWQLPVSDLAAVAEYTTDQGPSADDYFLVFVAVGSRFFEASYYAEGRDECLRVLGQTLGAQLTCRLRHSTSSRSQILWPKALIGAPLFATRSREARSLAGRLRDAIGVGRHERELSRAVRSHAAQRRS